MLITPALLLLLQAAPAVATPERVFDLMLGDPAPAIQVAEWVQGTPVTKFEPGMNYVVEFWATWCGPCRVAIPHLNELSQKYAGKVRFVGVSVSESISDESPYSVPQFVKEMGSKMTYNVASDRVKADDPHRMNQSWMNAAGQSGIPTAFIVNGQGKIAWIGHPMRMDQPLAEIVAGTYDLAAATKKYAQDMRIKGVSAKLAKEITKAKKEKDFVAALRLIDEAVAAQPALEESYGLEKYFLLVEAQRGAEAASFGQRLVSQLIADNPMALNQLAWSIVDPQGKWKTGDYALAVRAAELAVKLQDEKDASTLDTLGLALFRNGAVERAIQVQEKAVTLAKDLPNGKELLKELSTRLEEFKRGKQGL